MPTTLPFQRQSLTGINAASRGNGADRSIDRNLLLSLGFCALGLVITFNVMLRFPDSGVLDRTLQPVLKLERIAMRCCSLLQKRGRPVPRIVHTATIKVAHYRNSRWPRPVRPARLAQEAEGANNALNKQTRRLNFEGPREGGLLFAPMMSHA